MLTRKAQEAGLAELRVHPHQLRRATGYKLANDGSTRGPFRRTWGTSASTTRPDTLAADRFRGLFRDREAFGVVRVSIIPREWA